MRIGLIHNDYGARSGEETMFYQIADLLKQRGHQVYLFTKTSCDIGSSVSRKVGAFFNGIYSFQSRRQIRSFIQEFRPEIIQIQNLYPLISPSILREISRFHIPVVMRCANYRLLCPNGLLLRDGKICHRCVGGKEWWCILTNCEKNIFKSTGYALRNYVARTRNWYQQHVTRFYTQTQFQRNLLVQNGYPPDRIDVIGNMVSPKNPAFTKGRYIGYLGRISEEKGIHTFLEAAEKLPHIPFKIAGRISMKEFQPGMLPDNVKYAGFLENCEKEKFLQDCSVLVVSSICYEGFPSSIIEAMNYVKPVIGSAIGGLPEVVKHNETGLLFQPGNSADLAEKINSLWSSEELRKQMGEKAHALVCTLYSEEYYYQRLCNLYQKARKYV